MGSFFIYIYFDKRNCGRFIYQDLEFPYLPVYVGKGKKSRHTSHLVSCFNSRDQKAYKRFFYKKLRKMINSGNFPEIIIYENNLSEEEAFQLEISLITKIGRRIYNTGPLCNNSIGGEGTTGSHNPRYKVCVYNDDGRLIKIENSPSICIRKYNITERTIYKHMSGKQISSKFGLRFRKESDNILKLDSICDVFINRRHKTILQYDLKGNLLGEHFSVSEASRTLNISRTGIDNNLNNRSKKCNKYVFKYK